MNTDINQEIVTRKKQHKSKSMFQIVFAQFLEHRFAVFGLVTIFFFIFLALIAPLISKITGHYPYAQNMFHRYQPAGTTAPYSDEMIEDAFKTFAVDHSDYYTQIVKFLRSIKNIDTSEIEFDLEGGEFFYTLYELYEDYPELKQKLKDSKIRAVQEFLNLNQTFYRFHLFGTDELGRDVFIRLIYGTRVSVGMGLLVAFTSAVIGLLVGSIAGFYGGVIDNILMRITDALLSLPLMPILIIMAAIDINKIPFLKGVFSAGTGSIFKLVFVLGAFSWMSVARLVRGNILSMKEKDFIHAAKTLGAKNSFIIRKHLTPNVIAPFVVAVTVNIGSGILWEAGLSFLGLGIQPPMPSWGNMLLNAVEIVYEAPLLAILPGLMIFIVVVSINFLGDGLQDAVDPKAIRR